jgi:hypothetical protein
MTSNNPNSVSQQGLTNKSPGLYNTQQSIVNYMSNSSDKIKTTEKKKTKNNTNKRRSYTNTIIHNKLLATPIYTK